MAWARIWMLFECFGSASPKAFEAGDSSFFVRSAGDVSAVFRAAVSHGLGTNPAAVRVFRKRSFSTCCATFRHFFYLLFRMAWARIWMLFECFGSASPRAFEAGDSSFLVRSVGDVSAVFRAAVSHGLGTNPAAVRVFRKRSFSTCCATFRHFFYLLFRMAWARIWMLFECFGSASPKAFEAGDSSFLMRFVGDVSAVFRAAVSHGLGTNPAAVRVFRKRSFSTCCATFRHFFYLLFRMAWARIWMLFECFGSASPRALEAGDCSFLVRSVGDVSAVFRAAVSHGLGTNPAAVRVFRKRSFSTCCATFRHFFYLLFRMAWARIWMLFECFGSASPKAFEAGDSSFKCVP